MDKTQPIYPQAGVNEEFTVTYERKGMMATAMEASPTRGEYILDKLQSENAVLKGLLTAALDKIEKYHAHLQGEYVGGMPNQILLPEIRKALGK